MDDLAALDAAGQAQLVRSGEVTAEELVDAAITRIESLNPGLNAVITPLFERAREQAGAVDAAVVPFPGVPFLLKDALSHTAGDPYHYGMQALKNEGYVASHDTFLAARLRASGLALCGKTNTPELAAASVTEPLAYGPTANPWDLSRTPGGSSGGSAAAVAAGLVPIAHGNDMLGSIRIPASACGVVGLKPTRGRITLGPDFGEFAWQAATEFALTRSVRDAAALLDAVGGGAAGDPYAAEPPSKPYRNALNGDFDALRVGVSITVPGSGDPVHAECRASVERTADLLESMGHHVELEAPAALERPLVGPVLRLMRVHLAREVDRWSARLGRELGEGDIEPDTIEQAELGRSVGATEYVELVEEMHEYGRALGEWWEDFDVLLTPTIPGVPAVRSQDGKVPANERPTMGFTAPFNISGQPAISLPVHWSDDGIPVGVQLAGGYGREDLLLQVSSQLEEAIDWAARYPATPS